MATPAPAPPFRLNYGEAFTFLFRDPHWIRKCALLILFWLLGVFLVPYFFVFGYVLTLSERVMRLETQAMPDWGDFGALFRKGWRVFLVRVVYYLPIILIYLIMIGLMVAAIVALGGLSGFSGNPGGAATGGAVVLFLLIIPLSLLLIPLALIIPCLTPAADAQLVLHNGEIEPAFRVGQVFAFIRRNLGQYILMIVIYVGGTQFVSGGLSVSFQFGSVAIDSNGNVNTAVVAMLVVVGIVAVLATSLITLYLRCAQAHMIGQLCWHEQEKAGHGG